MSRNSDDNRPEASDRHEGWEGLAEEATEKALHPGEELEQALREAAEAVEERRGDRPAGAARKGKLAEELEATRAELEAARERMLRTAADLENFRRRALKDRQEALQYGHQNLVKDLLPTVDNLERAIDHAREGGEGDRQGLLEGVELVLRELLTVLQKHGVAEIEAHGKPFDPEVHEAMTQAVDGSVAANTVVQVFQRGYLLRDRLLRPTRVAVSKPGDAGSAGEDSEA